MTVPEHEAMRLFDRRDATQSPSGSYLQGVEPDTNQHKVLSGLFSWDELTSAYADPVRSWVVAEGRMQPGTTIRVWSLHELTGPQRSRPSKHRPARSRVSKPIEPGTVLTQAEERLGLSKTALASICNVSRQTIYAWLSGENEPAPENTAALQRLARLSSRADVTAHPLKRRWTRVTSEEDDLTLRDVLSASEPDEQRALALIEELVERSQAWDHQREKRLSEASEKEERKTTRRALADLSRPVSTE